MLANITKVFYFGRMLKPEFPSFTPEDVLLRNELTDLLNSAAQLDLAQIGQYSDELNQPTLFSITGKTIEEDPKNSENLTVEWVVEGGSECIDILIGYSYFTVEEEKVIYHNYDRLATDDDLMEIRYALSRAGWETMTERQEREQRIKKANKP